MRNSTARGFTHIELLLCFLIIALLASLLLSVVGRARESARGSQCKDHLHNLILAAVNFEGVHGAFPAGAEAPAGPVADDPLTGGFSWTVRLLPYVEQQPFYDTFDFSRPPSGQLMPDSVQQAEIYVFTCPADDAQAGEGWPPSSYAGCHHHVEAPIDVDNTGLFILNRPVRREQLRDGAQHTIAFGEKLTTSRDLGWVYGTRATLRNGGTPLVAAINESSPSTPLARDPLFVGGFGSRHPWGVHFAFADGSTRLVPGQIDPLVLQKLGHRNDGELIDPTPLQQPDGARARPD